MPKFIINASRGWKEKRENDGSEVRSKAVGREAKAVGGVAHCLVQCGYRGAGGVSALEGWPVKLQDISDEMLKKLAAEAVRRGLVEVDLSDVLASPEGRKKVRYAVGVRASGGRKPNLKPDKEKALMDELRAGGGPTWFKLAEKYGVSWRTVARYAERVKREAAA